MASGAHDHPAPKEPNGIASLVDRPYLLIVTAMLLWSGNFVVARAVAGHVPPIALAQMRWSLAFLVLIALFHRHVRQDLPVLRARWRTVAVFAFLGIGIYNTLIYVGMARTTVVNAALLAAIFPLVIAAAGFLLYRDRLTLAQFAGILAGSAGALVVLSKGDLALLAAFRFNPGDLLILASQWAWAFYTVLLRARPPVHPLSFLTATVFVGQLMLVPATLWEGAAGARVTFDTTTVLAVIYVALFAAVLAFLCFNRAVAILGSNRTGPFFHLVPVFGSALAVVFLGEHVAPYHLAGWALILAGIAAAQLGRRTGATVSPT